MLGCFQSINRRRFFDLLELKNKIKITFFYLYLCMYGSEMYHDFVVIAIL